MLEFIGGATTGITDNRWKLVLDWCMVAVQQDAGGGSCVAHTFEVPLSEDRGFVEWCIQKVGTTLRPQPTMGQGGGGGNNDMVMAANMVNHMG